MAILPATLACMVVTYLVCGIPFGLLVARAKGVDVRKTGSGNIGTTNVARSVGAKASGVTLLLDAGKGWACVTLFRRLIPALTGLPQADLGYGAPAGWVVSCVFLACILGHVFSPYLRFHGGKGIAVGFGAALGLCWPVALGLLAVFVAVVVPTRYVSAASVSAAVSLPLWCAAMGFCPSAIVPVALAAALVVWAHRANIGRLLRHEESRFSFHRSDDKGQAK